MHLNLEQKVVLITSAAGDIGSAIARAFASEGAHLALLDRNASGLLSLFNELQEMGTPVTFATADLTQVPETEVAVAQVLAPFGGRVDMLITTAGICPSAPLEEMLDPSALFRWRDLYEHNTMSALLPMMLVWHQMRDQGGGVILTMASDLARQPVPEMLPYSTAKAALLHLSHRLAAFLGQYHIRLVAIAPGPTRTALWTREGGLMDFYAQQHKLLPEEALAQELRQRGMALSRLIEPDEIAHLMVYLASKRAASITQCVVDVNGGSHHGY